MSSIEERLARDIAAVTGGITMTGQEIDDAREVLDERIEARRRRNTRRYAAAVAAVLVVGSGVVAFALDHGDGKAAGPAGRNDHQSTLNDADQTWLTGEALTQDALVGVWRVDNGAVALRFMANGLFSYSDIGSLFTDFADQDAFGAYTVDDSVITLINSTASKPDCAKARVRLHASKPETGKVRIVLDPDDTPGCSPVGDGQQALEQILPAMPDYASMASNAANENGWEPLTDATSLGGLYFDSANHLLELDQDATGPNDSARGRYYVVAPTDDVVDQGTWEASSGELTLTSSAESARCDAGDRLMLGDMLADPVSDGFRGTVTKDSCDVIRASGVWIHVPDSVSH
jgi:hypothetical protein